MELNLNNKVALVSGSSRGIGKAIGYGLLKEGAVVYLTGRDKGTLESVHKDMLSLFGKRVKMFCGDLTDTETIKLLISTIITEHKKLDVVVANIGTGRFKSGWDIDDEQWLESVSINLFSSVKLSRESIRVMMNQKSGTIIFISSIAGCEAIPAPVHYSSSKSALISYVKNTANIVASSGIRMNTVSPGNIFFEGGTWDIKMKEDAEKVNIYLRDYVPMQRLGRDEEVADVVCFLASERASFITGANFVVDGGQTKRIL